MNLANLLLARANVRTREIAVRMALGGSRARVVTQLFVESLLLSWGGAVAGIVLAPLLSRSLVHLLDTRQESIELNLGIDWRVMAFTASVALLTGLCFGLSTAIYATRARTTANDPLRVRTGTGDRQSFSFQRVLVVAQVAISLVLIVSSLLFVGSFQNLINLDPGLRQAGITFLFPNFRSLNLSAERMDSLTLQLLASLQSMPGVESAATTTTVPLSGAGTSLGVQAGNKIASSQFTWVSTKYFSTMDIPLLAGRNFSSQDNRTGPRVVLVNETFIRTFLDAGNPIGKTIRSLSEPNYPEAQYEIIGIVKDTKYSDLRQPLRPIAYAPNLQQPVGAPITKIIVRSTLPEGAVAIAAREDLAKVSPNLRITSSLSFRSSVLDRLARDRMMAWLAGSFGGLAVLLAAIGLYGAISYMTSGRRTEIGIRLALGATRPGVVWMVFRQAAALLAVD